MRKVINKDNKIDWMFAIVVLGLIFFGMVMISSSSVVTSMERYGNNFHFVSRQLVSFFIGVIVLIVTSMIDYRFWKKYSFILLIATLLMLILVFIPGIGKSVGGAHRWFGIGNQWFQPSELVKLTFILYLAAWMDKRGEQVKTLFGGFIPFAVLIGIIGILIMNQPDLGTMSIITISAVAVYFAAGASLNHLLIGFVSGLAVVGILIKSAPYRLQRLLVFLNPSVDTQGAAYHINQALLAIGSGGLWGLGFGQSKQKYLYLPQAHTDSIFAIIAEELGYVRSLLVIAAFILLGYYGLRIAKNAPDNFSRLVCVGIITWILVQAFINIGAMLSILPLTGVPMPFVSYGGSALIVLLAAVGIMLNISKHTGEKYNN